MMRNDCGMPDHHKIWRKHTTRILHSKGGTLGRLLLALLLVLSLPTWLAAQIDRGEITGTVEDSTGAVVPNATVVLTNTSTSVAVTTKSTSTGTYVFDDLLPGSYTINAQATGFEKYVVRGIVVHVQQVESVDLHLATGNVQQSVTVTGSAPLLQAENAMVGQTISNQAVNDLPLATRDWGSLAQLSAGVTTSPHFLGDGVTADAGSSESAYFSVNGVNDWQNDFRLNGINDNIEIYGGNYTLHQRGHRSAARRHAGIHVCRAAISTPNSATPRAASSMPPLNQGRTSLHGDLWEYIRNNDLNANYFFNNVPMACSQAHPPVSPEPVWLHGRRPGYDPARVPRQRQDFLVRRLSGRPVRAA